MQLSIVDTLCEAIRNQAQEADFKKLLTQLKVQCKEDHKSSFEGFSLIDEEMGGGDLGMK